MLAPFAIKYCEHIKFFVFETPMIRELCRKHFASMFSKSVFFLREPSLIDLHFAWVFQKVVELDLYRVFVAFLQFLLKVSKTLHEYFLEICNCLCFKTPKTSCLSLSVCIKCLSSRCLRKISQCHCVSCY